MAENISTEALIDAVRQHPILYDISQPDYKDIEKKNEIWQEMSNNLQQDCDAIKTRWRSLRDCYSKFKRTQRTTTGQAAKKYKKWPWAQQMSFLDAVTALRPTSSNIAFTTSITTTTTSTLITPIASTSSTDTSILTANTDIDVTPESDNVERNIGRRRKRKTSTTVDPATAVVNYLKNRDQNNNKTQKSDIDLLFRSYAETFKKYSPLIQARLKLDIAKLFADAEIREIEQQQMTNYSYSSAYSTISTDSPSPSMPQSYIATPSPQPEDLSSSRFQQNSGLDGFNFQLLANLTTPASSTNLQQQHLQDAAVLPTLQPQYLDRSLPQSDDNASHEVVFQNL